MVQEMVAPHAGAWIEILRASRVRVPVAVAPHAGAWIEIRHNSTPLVKHITSLPTRERGLKCLWYLQSF